MMEKILEGSLACFEVPDLLTFLNMGKRTGVLVMEHPDQETKIFFKEGKPIFATSTKEELRIGNMLLRQGKIDVPTLEAMLVKHRGAGQRLGEVLLMEKLLKREELASFLKIQVSEVIFDTFDWRRGLFSFFDRIPPPDTAVTLEMDIQNLIMEGVRRIDERGRLSEVFPDLNMVADAVANPERIKQSVTLTREEWQVLFLVDGRRSLSEICRLAGNADELATLQIIHNLVVANLIVVAAAREPSQPMVDEPAVLADLTQKVNPDKPQPAVVPPAVHRILWDEYLPANGRLAVPTVFSAAKIAGKTSAMVVGKEKFLTLKDAGSLDSAVFTPMGDQVVANQAILQIDAGFDLVFAHFGDVDLIGHEKRWMSDSYLEKVAQVDAAIGRVLRVVPYNMTVILTADHGGSGNAHGTTAALHMTIPWIIQGPGVKAGHALGVRVNTYDTAATAAYVLGFRMADINGRVVSEAFQ